MSITLNRICEDLYIDLNRYSNGLWVTLDNTKFISEMKGRGSSEARTQSPELLREFFYGPAESFVPIYKVDVAL